MAGGLTKGKSHAKGGIKMKVKSTGQNIEVEGGEGIINKHTMSSKDKHTYEGKEMTACEIASDLNQKTGNGVSFDCDETKNTDMTPTDPSTGFAKGGKTDGSVKWKKNIGDEGWSSNMKNEAAYENQGGYISEDGDYTISQDVRFDNKMGVHYRSGDWTADYKEKPLTRKMVYGNQFEDERFWFPTLKDAKRFVNQHAEKQFSKGGKPKRKYKKKKMAKSKKKTGAFGKLVSKIMKRDGIPYKQALTKAKDEYVSGATSQKKQPKKSYKGRLDKLKSKAPKKSYSGRPKKAKGGDIKNSPYKLAKEEIELIDKFDRVGFDNKVFTHYLTESKNADKETYYNHKVYNPFKDKIELLGQFRDRGEAIDSFYSYKPKSYAKGGELMDSDTQVDYAKGGKVSADDFTPYARVCDVTGEGMNEGYLMGDSYYVKYEKDLIKELRKDFPDQENLSDEELTEQAYEDEYYYYTEWEDPSDVDYVEYKGKLYDKDELEDKIPAKDFEVFMDAYGIIYDEYAKGGDVSGKPVVESLDKIVTHYNGDDFDLDNYPPKDGSEWMSDAMELTLEEAKQFAKELDYELDYDDEYIDEAENLQDLQYAILENTQEKANQDNTYNASWWGGVVDFFVLERKEDEGYGEALVILRMHRGGDPRGNYYGYQAFKLNSFIEDFPAYYANLTYQIETNQGTITLETEDMEGYSLIVREDETGTFEVDDYVTLDDVEEKLDMNKFNIY